MRNLERELSTLIRKAVKELILSEKKSVKASADNLADYLGVPKYRYGEVEDKDQIGIVTGLAWTDVGGELLTIEAANAEVKPTRCGHRTWSQFDPGRALQEDFVELADVRSCINVSGL